MLELLAEHADRGVAKDKRGALVAFRAVVVIDMDINGLGIFAGSEIQRELPAVKSVDDLVLSLDAGELSDILFILSAPVDVHRLLARLLGIGGAQG